MPGPRPTPYSKDEPALTYTVIKQLIEDGIQRAINTISDRFAAVENRVVTIEEKTKKVQEDQTKLSQETTSLAERYAELKTSTELLRRHAFSFEFLVHGIPESDQTTSDWLTVQGFLTHHNLGEVIPQLDGVAYRLGRPRETSDRPRPIVVKDSSRRCIQTILTKTGKKNLPVGSPYCSPHLTKLQLENIRIRANKKHNAAADNAPMDN